LQVNWSKEQLITLLELVYMGNWMATSYFEEIPKHKEKYEAMETAILALARQSNLEHLVTGDEDCGYFFSSEFEDGPVQGCIDDYDDYTFWHQLADHLANRDLIEEFADDVIKAMTDEERFIKKDKIYWAYMDEFGKYGIDRFRLIKNEE
jgi:hypothetical protein